MLKKLKGGSDELTHLSHWLAHRPDSRVHQPFDCNTYQSNTPTCFRDHTRSVSSAHFKLGPVRAAEQALIQSN